jgi:hypothetical protein
MYEGRAWWLTKLVFWEIFAGRLDFELNHSVAGKD